MAIVAKFHIVRHGETDENRLGIMQGQLDTRLNQAGINQARMTAIALENIAFQEAYTSDLCRATKVRSGAVFGSVNCIQVTPGCACISQTAEIILEKHDGVPLQPRQELRERVCTMHCFDPR